MKRIALSQQQYCCLLSKVIVVRAQVMKLTSATLSRHADKSREIELREDGKTYQRNDKKIAD